MSFELPSHRKKVAQHGRWPGAAFLVEAMLLLVFVMGSMAVFTQMFAAASQHANQSRELTDAVAATSAMAERFAADPASVPDRVAIGDAHVVCLVSEQQREGGILYKARISAYGNAEDADRALAQSKQAEQSPSRVGDGGSGDEGSTVEPVYSIDTAKYESGV